MSTQTPIQIKRAASQCFVGYFIIICGVANFIACVPRPPGAGTGAAAGAGQPQVMTPFEFIFQTVTFFLMGLFVYYLLVLKPANDRNTQRDKFFDGLKKNDEVLIGGGIYGRVFAVKPDGITVEIAQGVRVRVKPESVMAPLPDSARNTNGGSATNGGTAKGKSEA